MKIRSMIVAVSLLVGSAGGASAQGPGPTQWPRASAPPIRLQSSLPAAPLQVRLLGAGPFVGELGWADSARIAATHWKTGALVGGTVLGLLGAVTFVGLCGFDAPCHHPALFAVGGFALGGVVGFGLGALVGGQFPARSP